MAEMRDIRITKGAPADRGAPSHFSTLLCDAILDHEKRYGRRPSEIRVSPQLWYEIEAAHGPTPRSSIVKFARITVMKDPLLFERTYCTWDPGPQPRKLTPSRLKLTQAEWDVLTWPEQDEMYRDYDEITIVTGRK